MVYNPEFCTEYNHSRNTYRPESRTAMSPTETPKATDGAEADDGSGSAEAAEPAGTPAVVTAAPKAEESANG